MKVALVTPWNNAWVPLFESEIQGRGHHLDVVHPSASLDGYDVVMHGWSTVEHGGQVAPSARNVYFLRRFELFGLMGSVNWNRVDALITVNDWIRDRAKEIFEKQKIEVPVHLIYNAADPEKWSYKERSHGNSIGMACHVHPKKNLPLAMQVLSRLEPEYELHIAGEIQDPCTAEYLLHMANDCDRRVHFYGHVPYDQMNTWWGQRDYCLSTSISEGCPNNVIEAMMKGIKPVVHNWPGSDDQFRPWVFRTSNRAAHDIKHQPYQSQRYRSVACKLFGLQNIAKMVDIALGANRKEVAA